MKGKIALEEHFAIPETLLDSAGFVPGDYWKELSARILDKEGKIVAAQIFRGSQKLTALEPAAAVTAFDGAFATVAKDLIFWTVNSL